MNDPYEPTETDSYIFRLETELETAHATQDQLRDELVAQQSEIERLRGALEAAFKKADSYWEQIKYIEREKQWGHLSDGLLETVEIIQSALNPD